MDLLKSKKFRAAVIGLVVAVAAEWGLELDPEKLLLILSPILTFIGGQAIADVGKEKAKAEQKK